MPWFPFIPVCDILAVHAMSFFVKKYSVALSIDITRVLASAFFYFVLFLQMLQVAADARLLSLKTTTFGCEEGSLTGESVAVSKSVESVAADSTIAVSI